MYYDTPNRLNRIIPAKIGTMREFGKENVLFHEEDMISSS